MKTLIKFTTLLCLILTFSITVYAKDENDNKTKKSVKLKTKLIAVEGVETNAKGKSQRRLRERGNRSRDRLKIKVVIPVPSIVPELSDIDLAGDVQVIATVKREDEDFAVCKLDFNRVEENDSDEVSDEDSSLEALYKLDLRSRDNRKGVEKFVAKKGSCNLDLEAIDEVNGIPDILEGDQIVITVDETGILSGEF